MPAGELNGLFAHEILVHGLSAVNGGKLDPKLATGLPGYLEIQEGIGVFLSMRFLVRFQTK